LQDTVARVTREVDAGLETIELDLPAVLTTDLRLNEPRYIKLPDIMKAKKKPLEVIDFATLGLAPSAHLKLLKTEPPSQRSRGIIVKDTAALLAALRQRGLVS
jgi:electron transfer flavoprotein beta subunit